MQIVTLIEFMTYENSVNIQMTDWATFVRQRHFSDTEITAVGQISLSDKCPDRRHLSESGSHLSDTKITAVGQMSLSDKCPDRRHLSESGLLSFSQAWCRAGVVACTRIPMLQEDVISWSDPAAADIMSAVWCDTWVHRSEGMIGYMSSSDRVNGLQVHRQALTRGSPRQPVYKGQRLHEKVPPFCLSKWQPTLSSS